jgi:hypothetical protein
MINITIAPQTLIMPMASLIRKSALTSYLTLTFIEMTCEGVGTASPGVLG